MSGQTFRVTCQTCERTDFLEVYTENWNNLEIDCSKAQCWECHKKTNPQDWHDYQCIRCSDWFNHRDSQGVKTNQGTWLCPKCTGELIAAFQVVPL